VSSQPRETRSSPLRTNKITAYFSSETTVVNGFHDPHQDEEDIEDDGDSSTSDIITFATSEELGGDDDVGGDGDSGKENNEDWHPLMTPTSNSNLTASSSADHWVVGRALSPRVLDLAPPPTATSLVSQLPGASGPDLPQSSDGPEPKDPSSSNGHTSSSSPLQPRRVTRSRTAKTTHDPSPSSPDLKSNGGLASPPRNTSPAAAAFCPTTSPARPTRSQAALNGTPIKTPPQSPPTPHKIKLLEERRGGSTDEQEQPPSESSTLQVPPPDSSSAKRVISFAAPASPKKNSKAPFSSAPSSTSEPESGEPAAAAPGSPNKTGPRSNHRRDLTRLFGCQPSNHTALESDQTTGSTRLPTISAVNGSEAGSKVSTRAGSGLAAADKEQKVPVATLHSTAATTKSGKQQQQQQAGSRKVTDFFQVRRSGRKPKTELKAQQQSEIEAMLERGVRDDDSGLGIGIRHYPNKGRGIEAQKHFKKGDFIVEYAGDLMDLSEAKQRENEYAANAAMGCYMYYFKHSDKQYCIDATAESGRLGRLLNHSMRNPNCQTKVVMVRDTPRLILIAKTDIEPGTELLYDYGDRNKESLEAHPWLAL